MLEQLGCAEEQRGGLLRAEALANIQEVDNPREESSTLPRADGRIIEDASFLDDCGFIVVVGAKTALLLFFGRESHGRRWWTTRARRCAQRTCRVGVLLTLVWSM